MTDTQVNVQIDTTPVETTSVPVVTDTTTPQATPTPVDSTPATGTPEASGQPEGTTEQTPLSTESQETTVLGEDPNKTPVEPDKAPEVTDGVEAPETNEGGQSDEPAPPPKYDPFVLPEGITLKDEKVGEFTNLLAELETSGKASHEAVQVFGQKAVEFYLNEAKNIVNDVQKYYQLSWDKQRLAWKDEFLADPDFGGNRQETTIAAANEFIRTHGGTPEEQAQLRKDLDTSGLGNKLSVIRLFARAGAAMQEGKPLAASRPVSEPKSKLKVMYG